MARSTRAVRVTVILAAGAIAVCLLLAWRWLQQPGEAEELLDILAGQSVPDAAWALERLRSLPDEDLRVLARHVDDDRPAPLDPAYRDGRRSLTREARLLLGAVVRDILQARTDDGRPVMFDDRRDLQDRPESWDASRWSAEVDRWLAGASASESETRTRWGRAWLRLLGVRPPSFSPDSVRPLTAETAATIAACLRGDDKALAVWMVETLRLASDEVLGALAHLATSAQGTSVSFFGCREDPVSHKRGFALGPLVQMLLAERLGDAVLYYNVRRAAEEWPGYDRDELAGQVEAAWKEREGRRR